jgi:hypothetical protein
MAAPIGNKFYKLAQKTLGRPRYYETFEELQQEIIAYFKEQDSLKKPKYTMTGLTAWLGFVSRADFKAQGERGEDFSYLIKASINIVASCYEENLYSTTPAGAIFALKNIKSDEFKDKTEVDQKVTSVNWHEEKTYEAKPEANDSH